MLHTPGNIPALFHSKLISPVPFDQGEADIAVIYEAVFHRISSHREPNHNQMLENSDHHAADFGCFEKQLPLMPSHS